MRPRRRRFRLGLLGRIDGMRPVLQSGEWRTATWRTFPMAKYILIESRDPFECNPALLNCGAGDA